MPITLDMLPDLPAGTVAVSATVTLTEASARGFASLVPSGQTPPSTSTLNAERVGHTLANNAVTTRGPDGVELFTKSGAHLLVDINGYFVAAAGPVAGGRRSRAGDPLVDRRADLGTSGHEPCEDAAVPSAEEFSDDDLDDLIHRADLDGLVRMIDDRCATRDWPGLLRVRDRARSAVKTGRQLWPAATLAEYRLALLGSPEHVAAVLDESDGLSGQFTIGPLTEVAAQHHTWDALRDHLDPSPRAAFVAHERAIRGETVDDDLPEVLDMPLEIQGWEPQYAVATYADNGAEFPAPKLPSDWEDIELGSDAERLDDDVQLAVEQLVEPWVSGSNGTVEVVCVDGDAGDAIGSFGLRRARVAELDVRTAMAWIAWAGASGGAHGRRRGAASGRFGAWWLLGALGDFADEWPVDPDALGQFANELRWYRWDAHEPAMGWSLQLVIEDPDEEVSWAINARDA